MKKDKKSITPVITGCGNPNFDWSRCENSGSLTINHDIKCISNK